MTILDKAIIYVVAALGLALGAWWAKDSVFKAIRAPVVAQLEQSKTANASLEKAIDKAKAETARLDTLLSERDQREAKSNKRLGVSNAKFEQLAKINSVVQSWADVVVPADVIGVRIIPETPSADSANGVLNPNELNKPSANVTTIAAGNDQRRVVEALAIAGDATRPVQQPVAGREPILPASKDTTSEVKPTLRQKFNQLWSTR
jgi:hypothetical protein